jgi:uncharacterized protein YbaA (DUF1428 family)
MAMAHYVEGFVIPVAKKNLNAYRRMAQKGGKIWREHGALEFRECVGDDLNVKMGRSFPRGIVVQRISELDRAAARLASIKITYSTRAT